MPSKPFKTTEQLVSLLCDERGLSCDNRFDLFTFLQNTNYYRFSGYARQWQKDPAHHINEFEKSATFEHIRDMLQLDHQLRQLILEQSSYVETIIRARYAHEFGHLYGATAFYLDRDRYSTIIYRDGTESDTPYEIAKELNRSKSRMVEHYRTPIRHEDLCDDFVDVPIWVAVEVLSFGKISKIVRGFKDIQPAKETAQGLGLQWALFQEHLHSFCALRNMCAHHNQLWHRKTDIACAVPKKVRHRLQQSFDNQSVFATIVMLNEYRRKIDGDTKTAEAIMALIASDQDFAEGIMHPSAK